MNFCLHPESFRGGKYNPNVFKPGRNGNVHNGLIPQLDTTTKVGRALPHRPNFHQNERSDVLACVVRSPMVPPASLRLLAVSLGQTGRFALPSLGVVSSCAL